MSFDNVSRNMSVERIKEFTFEFLIDKYETKKN